MDSLTSPTLDVCAGARLPPARPSGHGELGENGYDGGEELSYPTKEAWIFEMVGPGPLWQQGDPGPGAYWVAQRVPDGHIAASANNAVIREIDWDDHENFMYSPGILEYAIEKGWYKPDSGEEFSWRKHFVTATSVSSYRRVWRVMTLAAPSLVGVLNEKDLPFSVPVDKKLTLNDINSIQRDHYEGTEFDGTNSITAGPWNNPRRYRGPSFKSTTVLPWQRMIAQVQCEYSIATQSRAYSDEIGGVYGMAQPTLTSPAIPLYASMTELAHTEH